MRRLFLTLAALMSLMLALPAAAQKAPTQGGTGAVARAVVDPALVDRVLAYLNSMRTLETRFIQRDANGGSIKGALWVSRPGRLRFQYDAPENDVIWSNKGLIKHFDAELESVTHIPAHLTPAWFLLDDVVRIKKGVNILATAEVGNRAYLTATQDGALTDGRVTLAFQTEPFQIIGWNVVSGDGGITQVDLLETTVGEPIDKKIFRYEPPIEDNDTN